MLTDSAIALIGGIIYKPGWTFSATDHTDRFEGAIKVRIDYPAQDTAREDAANGYPNEIRTYAEFPMFVADCNDDVTLYRRVCDAITAIDAHEMREYFRVQPTGWAPFHPHQIDGMRRWDPTNPTGDLQFGIA